MEGKTSWQRRQLRTQEPPPQAADPQLGVLCPEICHFWPANHEEAKPWVRVCLCASVCVCRGKNIKCEAGG